MTTGRTARAKGAAPYNWEVEGLDNFDEVWSRVPGWGGAYEASSFGRIRSVDRDVVSISGVTSRRKGVVLRPYLSKNHGYQEVALCHKNRHSTMTVHSLVCLAHYGPADGLVVRHLDGKKQNNHLWNLKYGTHQENSSDAAVHGTKVLGNGKLSEAQVRAIRSDTRRQADIGADYGIHQVTVSEIKLRKIFAWLR